MFVKITQTLRSWDCYSTHPLIIIMRPSSTLEGSYVRTSNCVYASYTWGLRLNDLRDPPTDGCFLFYKLVVVT